MLKRVLITAEIHPFLQQQFEKRGWLVDVHSSVSYQELTDSIHEYSVLIVTTYLQINKEIINRARELKIIGRVGSGMENIDTNYCTEKNIICLNSPEGNANAVGEHALSMLLGLLNKITIANIELRKGLFNREANRGEELNGKKIGFIGFGNTGSAFAKVLLGFDVRILAHDPHKKIETDNVVQTDLKVIQEECDVISFHVPYNKETHHYCSLDFMQQCHKKPTIINTSRGAVCDTLAVIQALDKELISGFCVDVFEDEPIDKNGIHPYKVYQKLLAYPNVVATPHVAGWTRQSKLKLVEVLWDKIAPHLVG